MAASQQSVYAWVPTKEEARLTQEVLQIHIRHDIWINRLGGKEIYEGALWEKLEPSPLMNDPDVVPKEENGDLKALLDGAYNKFAANARKWFEAPLTFAERAKGVQKPVTFEAYLAGCLAAAKKPTPSPSWDFPKRVSYAGHTQMWRGKWHYWQAEKLYWCLYDIRVRHSDRWAHGSAFD